MKSLKTVLAISTLAAVSLVAACAHPPGSSKIPLASDSRPDFTGVWTSRGLTMTERAQPGSLIASDEVAAAIAKGIYDFIRSKEMEAALDPDAVTANVTDLHKVRGEWRTSYVTLPENGKLPFTAEAIARLNAADIAERTESGDGPEVRLPGERCMRGSGMTPLYQVPANNVRQFIQTNDHFLIYTEEGGDLRHVRMGGDPLNPAVTSRFGDSIGRWEGQELVIETTGVKEYASRFPWGTMVLDASSKVIERISMVSPGELVYQFTIEDPDLYSEPWSAEFPLFRAGNRIYEYGCHEGNYSLTHILQAARQLEQRK